MSQFRPKGGIGVRKDTHVAQFRANYDNLFRRPPRHHSRAGKCTANGDTCGAYVVKGEALCVGHKRSAEVNDEPRPAGDGDQDAA
jgi:hypothetical protein